MATQQEIKNNIVKDIASEFFNKIHFYTEIILLYKKM